MSVGNGLKADDGTQIAVPVSSLYHERSLREKAEGEAADALRRAERAERALEDLRQQVAMAQPESALGKRCRLELELQAAGLRKPRTS